MTILVSPQEWGADADGGQVRAEGHLASRGPRFGPLPRRRSTYPGVFRLAGRQRRPREDTRLVLSQRLV